MEERDDLTRWMDVDRKTSSDQTVVDDTTRIVPRRVREPSRAHELDPPTRLAIASAKRMRQHHVLQPGALIKDRFRLEYEIGRGGMGIVYAARDLRKEEVGDKDSLIAIKLLSEDFKVHPNALGMLQQECKKAQELAHPNIVTVYDFDRDEDMVYMTMEFLTGRSLSDYIEEHRFEAADLDDVLPIISDIVHGLDYAHKQGIIHSDLKPSNVHLTEKGVTKILDFGIARAVMASEVEQASETNGGVSQSEINNNLMTLTPSYASLEMFQGASPDPRDDIYALACITYQLLAGEHPYGRCPADKAMERQLVPKRIEGLKDWQWEALLNGLALERENRTASAGEFFEALLPKRREPWKWAAMAIAMVALVSTIYFVMQPPEIVEPSLFENPPPETELTGTTRVQVEEVLEVAEVHMMVGRLISPPGSNALDEFNKVLEIHPYNRRAIEGLKELLDELAQQAEIAMSNGDRKSAEELIENGLKVYNKHARLLELKQQLSSLRTKLLSE